MCNLDDPREAMSEQRPRLRVAPLALLAAAILVAGCQSLPPSGETHTATGCQQMDPTSKYAVYWSKDRVEAVEDIPSGLQRCIVAVAQPPSAPASAPMTIPTCSNGQVPSPAAAYYVDYYKDQPTVPLQIEDLRNSPPRCIKLVPNHAGGSSCPPPLGYHTVLINGVLFCVRN